MNEGKATRYHRLRRRTSLLVALGGLACGVTLLASGIAVGLRDVVRDAGTSLGLSGVGLDLGTAAVYAAALCGVVEVGMIPARFFQGYLLERRYRQSRVAAARWGLAQGVTALLEIGVVAAAAVGVTLCVRVWGDLWWVGCAVVFSGVTLATTNLAPVWVIPRLGRVRPLDRPSLSARLTALAARVGVPALRVEELAAGGHARRPQASLVGLGATRRILLSDALLRDFSDDEIEAVAAHELAHHVHRDLWQLVAFEFAVALAALWSGQWAVTVLGARLGLGGPGDPASLPLLALTAGMVVTLASPLGHALSRHQERRADRFALRHTGNATAFRASLRRLAGQHLAEERPSRLVELLWHSHPPLHRRLASVAAFETSTSSSRAGPRPCRAAPSG